MFRRLLRQKRAEMGQLAAIDYRATLDAEVEAYLSSRKAAKMYRRAWRLWCEFLGPIDPLRATPLHAQAWLVHRGSQRGNKPRDPLGSDRISGNTLAAEFSCLRVIYKALAFAGRDIKSPWDPVRAPSRELNTKRPTEMVPLERVKELIQTPSSHTREGIRDRALLAILFAGALRRGEAWNLKIGEIKRTPKGSIFLRLRATKSGKDVDQPLAPFAEEYLLALVQQRKNEGAGITDWLFVRYSGPANDPRPHVPYCYVLETMKRCCRDIGLPPTMTPHSARASAITRMLDKGQSHRAIKQFSRHASVRTVEIYDKRRTGIDDSIAQELDFDESTK